MGARKEAKRARRARAAKWSHGINTMIGHLFSRCERLEKLLRERGIMPPEADPPGVPIDPGTEVFILNTDKHSIADDGLMWWRAGGAGYTRLLVEAWRLPAAEATLRTEGCHAVAVPCEEAERLAVMTVPGAYLGRFLQRRA